MPIDAKVRVRRDAPPGAAGRHRTVTVSDDVHYRLKLLAVRCRASVGAVAEEILAEGLRRLGVEDVEGGGA